MNNSNNINKDKEKKKSEGIDGRDQFRVVITDESNAAIEEVARKVNEGFGAGAVSKSDIANYVFLNLSKSISDADVKALRALHFDDKKVLGTLLRGETELPDDLKKAIRAHYGISEKEKKRPLKTMPDVNVDPQTFGLDEMVDAPKTKVQMR